MLISSLALMASVAPSKGLVSPHPTHTKNTMKQDVVETVAPSMGGSLSRRGLISAGLAGLFLLETNNSPANAFDNKVSNQYDDRPKRRGSKVSKTIFSLLGNVN